MTLGIVLIICGLAGLVLAGWLIARWDAAVCGPEKGD